MTNRTHIQLNLLKATFIIIAFFSLSICLNAQQKKEIETTLFIDLKKIESEKGSMNYSLEELIKFMEDSIKLNNEIVLPKNTTEFERALCLARRVQHNDSQLVAIRMFKTLLEFECYRSRAEELYLRFLMGNSLKYVGAPLIAYNFMEPIFPEIIKEVKNPELYSLLLNNYASLLISIDSIEKANKAYLRNLKLYTEKNNEIEAYNARNNVGYTYYLIGELDSAKAYYRINQNEVYKETNPVLYAFAFGNYGSVMMEEGKVDSALYYFKKEVKLLNQVGSEDGLGNVYGGIAAIYKLKGQIDSAKHYFQQSLEKSKKGNALNAIVNGYNSLLKISIQEKGDTELASLLSNYLTWSDSLNKVENLRELKDELQVSKFLNIFEETEESKRRTDQLENQNKDLVYAIMALAFIIILLALIITFRYKNRNQLKEKNHELEEKNVELEKSYLLISDSNKKNEVLLKELHHRVKNNLQIISSLFNLQLNASNLNYEAQQVFQIAKNRIYSISLVHKKIYQSDNVTSLDFEEYIRDFSDELLKSTPNDVNLSIEIQRNPISIEFAIPLGLIFHELFTNSLKHAKPHDSLRLSIKHIDLPEGEKFIYTDNGVGVQNIEVMKEGENSIGVTLIHLLGEQLNAKIEYKEAKDGEHGFWLSIEGNFTS